MKSDLHALAKMHTLTRERVYTFTHSSGMVVSLIPKPMKTYFAVLGCRFGSVNQIICQGGKKISLPDGTAHFLEHKLFENEEGEDALEKFAEIGADANAFTCGCSTAYYFDCTEHFEEALEILLTFVTHPYFTKQTVEKEIGIISEEIAADLDSPGEALYSLLLKALYTVHPIRQPILGDKHSIRKITPELLNLCHKTFYTPQNLILTVSGDLDIESVQKVCDRCLPPATSGERPVCLPIEEPVSVFSPHLEKKMSVTDPMVAFGAKLTHLPENPWERTKLTAALNVLGYLVYGDSSALSQKLYENDLILSPLTYDAVLNASYAYLMAFASTRQPEETIEALQNALEGLPGRLTEDDFIRYKRLELGDLFKSLDSTEDIALDQFTYLQDGSSLFEYADALAALTIDDVRALAKTFASPAICASAAILPLETT